MSSRYTIEFVAELTVDDPDETAEVIVAAKGPAESLKAALEAVEGVSKVTLTKKLAGKRAANGVGRPRKQKQPELAAAAE